MSFKLQVGIRNTKGKKKRKKKRLESKTATIPHQTAECVHGSVLTRSSCKLLILLHAVNTTQLFRRFQIQLQLWVKVLSSVQDEPPDRALGLVSHQQRASIRRVCFVPHYEALAMIEGEEKEIKQLLQSAVCPLRSCTTIADVGGRPSEHRTPR